MALLDDHGRLFGRVNLIDAAVGVFVLALVPLAYASWLLFRTPMPVVAGVEPRAVREGYEEQDVRVSGRNLRPYLRVTVGTTAATYLFESPDRAMVRLPKLSPGAYDLVLFDEAKEVTRRVGAITVEATPVVSGKTVPPPRRVLADIEVIVRFVVRPEVLEMVKRGPSNSVSAETRSVEDTQRALEPGQERPLPKPVLVSYEVTDDLVGQTKNDLLQGRMSVVRGLVRVTAVRTPDGWQHGSQTVRAGMDFMLVTDSYLLRGEVLTFRLLRVRPQ